MRRRRSNVDATNKCTRVWVGDDGATSIIVTLRSFTYMRTDGRLCSTYDARRKDEGDG